MSTRQAIDEFLAQRRIAVVGMSRQPGDFSRALFREFRKRGYDVIPVSPNLTEVEGTPCYGRVQDIQPPVDAALLMTTPDVTESVVHDCAEASVPRVWMYRATGKGAVSQRALEFCEQKGIAAIPGYCPFMFLPRTPFLHRLHGFLLKISGSYPN